MAKYLGTSHADPGPFPHGADKETQDKFWALFRRFNDSHQYEEKCKCGKSHIVETQQDNNPEYYTDVYFKCECGEYVHFSLPVN